MWLALSIYMYQSGPFSFSWIYFFINILQSSWKEAEYIILNGNAHKLWILWPTVSSTWLVRVSGFCSCRYHNTTAKSCPVSSVYFAGNQNVTLKTPRKPAFGNVVCLCRLLNILANISNQANSVDPNQTVPSLIWVHTVCKKTFKNQEQMRKQTTIVVVAAQGLKLL